MTKPIVSVAAMMLWEEGAFELTDEISRWLPEFADVRVYDKGSVLRPYTVPAIEPIRVWHLLTHTSGLTYGFLHTSVVDAIYRANGYDWGSPEGVDLAAACKAWGGPAADVPARQPVGLLGGQRRAGSPDRGGLRAEPGRLPRRPDLPAARQ